MNSNLHLGAALALAVAACSHESMSLRAEPQRTYPAAPRTDVVDDYHGTKVPDPYRWLEDPDSAPTRAWIEAQNALTEQHLAALPARGEIRARLETLWNYERFGVPQRRGETLFFTRNSGLQNQPPLFVQAGDEGAPRLLLDPNTLRDDGTAAIADFAPSKDGKLLAYQVSEAGSDWTKIRVRDVASGKDLADAVDWVKFSRVAWLPDASGFYYSTYPEHDTSGKKELAHHTLYFHRLGDPQSKDVVVHAAPDHPTWSFGAIVSGDGELLLVVQTEGTEQKTRVHARKLADTKAPLATLFGAFDADYDYLGKRGDRLWFRTDAGAPKAKIIAIDWRDPAPSKWTTVVPESADSMEFAAMAGDALVVSYLRDAKNVVQVFDLDGKARGEVALPPQGSVDGIAALETDPRFAFVYQSFTTPAEVWLADSKSLEAKRWRSPKVAFDPKGFVTEQIWCTSKDGTRVPMFVARRADVSPSSDTRVMLYGYGGFNIPLKPRFSPATLAWIERGGVWASVNLRGGGEFGREWHDAGTKERKQNVFDDFYAAAEDLVKRGWTSPSKIAIHGRSNGGLLVGAAMTQRPELFGCALPGVGVLDMLRFQKFTIGRAWISDYGCAEDRDEFPYLVRYSPLHNLRAGVAYPPTLVTTGDHDDRVVPAHSFKFAAELQHVQTGGAPALIRIETRGGHGAGKPTSMQIDEIADMWAFAEDALDGPTN